MNWRQNIFETPWNFTRWLRLSLGLLIALSGFMDESWPVGLFGVFLMGQALSNTGCAGSSCQVSPPEKVKDQ